MPKTLTAHAPLITAPAKFITAPAQLITAPAKFITAPAKLITAPAQPPAIRAAVYTALFYLRFSLLHAVPVRLPEEHIQKTNKNDCLR